MAETKPCLVRGCGKPATHKDLCLGCYSYLTKADEDRTFAYHSGARMLALATAERIIAQIVHELIFRVKDSND